MTVAELIKHLQTLPQDMRVMAEGDYEGGDYAVMGAESYTDQYYGTGTYIRIYG